MEQQRATVSQFTDIMERKLFLVALCTHIDMVVEIEIHKSIFLPCTILVVICLLSSHEYYLCVCVECCSKDVLQFRVNWVHMLDRHIVYMTMDVV